MIRLAPFLLVIFATALAAPAISSADDPPAADAVYELRIYTCEPGRLDALHARFRDHTLRLFEKHGMRNVAYWTPLDEPLAATTLVYLLEHKSRAAADASWREFRADPEWIRVREASEKDGKILAKAPESTFMSATDYSPEFKAVNPDRVYELRTYTAAGGKLDGLHARFRDHTTQLFEKHGIHNMAYWTPLDPPKSEHTLVYVVEHAARDAAASSWKAFLGDPEWQRVHAESEADGKLVSDLESMYLVPTPYSPRP